ncbi:hypothetical protein HG263_20760 [Pseudoalteromonas sp. JBTF-M23]|uniref:Uncharacterized protein n=1 Tax=Pseudoalteromonas caenipelagi TaxID=2726988 RepID=A0A849VI31_9GAMM|nr:hypothetical protein [Pseudoalteromonas caenipelagi]NOU52936.1 hypothetical protein [Pseudoalteromonas caenipelagi]
MKSFDEFKNITSVHDIIDILQSHADYTFSPDKNRLVLKDTQSHRLVLYKGPSCFGATVSNSAAHSVCLLQGSLRIKRVPLQEKLVNEGTSQIFVANAGVTITSLEQGEALQIGYMEAFDYHASSDACWMALYDKEVAHCKSVKLCAVTLEPLITTLLYQNHARLFNFIEILARSTCEKSFQALLALSKSQIDELAWRAIEGLYLRDPYKAAQLVSEYKSSHCCEVVRNRAECLIPSIDKMEA